MDVYKQIAALQADLNAAHHITYLTGAGVSTPSHIPDYRSNLILFIKKLLLVAIKMEL